MAFVPVSHGETKFDLLGQPGYRAVRFPSCGESIPVGESLPKLVTDLVCCDGLSPPASPGDNPPCPGPGKPQIAIPLPEAPCGTASWACRWRICPAWCPHRISRSRAGGSHPSGALPSSPWALPRLSRCPTGRASALQRPSHVRLYFNVKTRNARAYSMTSAVIGWNRSCL